MTLVNPKRKKRILVVDDEPSVRDLLSTLFREEDCEVSPASSVEEARQQLAKENWEFDLVVSDIQMPKETGFDLLAYVKSPDSPRNDLPVILTTAQLPEAENRVKGLALGAVDYVVRPIELKELVIRSMHAIQNYQRIQELKTSLQSSEDMAMVGRLLAASHHEIKNLAALVKISTDQLNKHLASAVRDNAAADRAMTNLTKSVNLMTDVARAAKNLTSSHFEQLLLKPVNLTETANDIVDVMKARVKPFALVVKKVTRSIGFRQNPCE